MDLSLDTIRNQIIKLHEAERSIPAVLVSGPPGVGKTYTGKEFRKILKARCKYVACSTINKDIISEIEEFCRTASSNLNWLLDETQYDMVHLDEIDQFGANGEKLREVMNQYSDTVFFYATTNYPEKVPQGLKDRFIHAKLSDTESVRQKKLTERLFSV